MVRGQSWRALSGVAGTRRLLADMKDAQRPVRAKRINVYVSNRIFRPDDVTKRQSGWLREILGPEGCPRTMFLNCNEEIKRKKERTIGNQNVLISTFCSRDRALVLALLLLLTSAWLLTLGRCATRIVRRCVFYSLKERGAE